MLASAHRRPAPSRTGGRAGSTRITDLVEDGVHEAGREKDFPIWDGDWRAAHDGAVEGLDQILHARLHVEIPRQERPPVRDHVPQVLAGQAHRRDELLHVALEASASERDQRFLVLDEDETVLGAIDAELMEGGTHL